MIPVYRKHNSASLTVAASITFHKRLYLLLPSVMVVVSSQQALCQLNRCDLRKMVAVEKFEGSANEAAVLIAKSFNISVVGEFALPVKMTSLPSGQLSLESAAKIFGPKSEVRCEGDSVLHVFDPAALGNKGNALNFNLAFWHLSGTVDEFVSDFRVRLKDEPWRRPEDANQMPQSGQGFLPSNYSHYTLKEQNFRNIFARELIFRVADQQCIISIFFVDTSHEGTPHSKWTRADQSWKFDVVR